METQDQINPIKTEFEQSVMRQIERLEGGDLHAIEAEVARKRTAWFKEKYPHGFDGPKTPRAAFKMLFFEYMGLSPEDLPVLSENETEIIWQSRNPCPTLEACQRLGMDTRRVCCEAYEKSTQTLIELIDPHLHFGRSYEEIRPYSRYCKEWILRK